MSGHTPELFDVYTTRSGYLTLLLSNEVDDMGFIPCVDWDGSPNGVLPSALGEHHLFVGSVHALPDLLAALDELTAVIGLTAIKHASDRANLQPVYDKARAAIAKARGEVQG